MVLFLKPMILPILFTHALIIDEEIGCSDITYPLFAISMLQGLKDELIIFRDNLHASLLAPTEYVLGPDLLLDIERQLIPSRAYGKPA